MTVACDDKLVNIHSYSVNTPEKNSTYESKMPSLGISKISFLEVLSIQTDGAPLNQKAPINFFARQLWMLLSFACVIISF